MRGRRVWRAVAAITRLRNSTPRDENSSFSATSIEPMRPKSSKRMAAKSVPLLDLLASLPLSVMLETSFTSLKTAQPQTQNGNFEFPQDISLFLSGAWTSNVGSFLQVTYDTQDDHFTSDNTDIRFANKTKLGGKELVYGIDLNNNPTVEDLWNSTPAWGYPWIASDNAPTPNASPFINGGLAQDVAGLGVFGMWNDHLYLDAAIYRSEHVGDRSRTQAWARASISAASLRTGAWRAAVNRKDAV